MKKFLPFLLVIFVFLACSPNKSLKTMPGVGMEESDDFVTEALPLHGKKDRITDAIYVRFYQGDRFIPYISVKYFLQEGANFSLENSYHSGAKHVYQNNIRGSLFSLVVDCEKDTIYCPEWFGYTGDAGKSSSDYKQEQKLFKKMLGLVRAFSGQKPRTFDLRKYGFKIYSGIDDAYVPVIILNQLFTTFDEYRLVYNGKDFYAFDENGKGYEIDSYPSYNESPWFSTEDGQLARRPKELIKINYNLLRFTHDYLYGQPGYYGFADDGSGFVDAKIVSDANSLDFDSMLKKYDPQTRRLLLADNYREYFDGLTRLLMFTYGDLHTNIKCWDAITKEIFSQEEFESINEKMIKSEYFKDFLSPKWKYYLDTLEALSEKKPEENKAATNIRLIDEGKTLIFQFYSFYSNSQLWDDYYSQEKLSPESDFDSFPKDTCGVFYMIFQSLKTNPKLKNVKNIIFDLSLNGGGHKFALEKVLPYVIGNGNVYMYDVNTETKNTEFVKTGDMNIDGVIDEKDLEFMDYYRKNYNFAVLTSCNTFSAANYFAVACEENGIPIIGKRSGGGSCVVGHGFTAEGFLFTYSLAYHLCNKNWESVESGAKITKSLEYDEFYDDDALQSVMDQLVAEGYYDNKGE